MGWERIKILFILAWMCALTESRASVLHSEVGIRMLASLQKSAISYFQEQANPRTGLIRDRARNQGVTPDLPRYQMASIAATGFGYAVLAHAASVGRVPSKAVYNQLLKSTDFLLSVDHFHGWFYHFMDWSTGQRFGNSEISTIDTALFFAGALYAAQIFPGTELSRKIRGLFSRVDFDTMLTDGGKYPTKTTFSHGWTPESGYLRPQWETFAEQYILLFLAMGKKGVPTAIWDAVRTTETEFGHTGVKWVGAELPLFAHQYSHLFIDFSRLQGPARSLFHNSQIATRVNRSACLSSKTSKTYRRGFWGLSATDTGDGYFAFAPGFENGTVCPPCAAASVMFLPEMVLRDLLQWRTAAPSSVWGRYGLSDSLNLDTGWINPDAVGISVGPVYLAIANLDPNTSVWKDFMKVSWSKIALARLQSKTNVAVQ